MARPGGRLRNMPERPGEYQTMKRRNYSWIEMGVLDAVSTRPEIFPDLLRVLLIASRAGHMLTAVTVPSGDVS